MIDHPTNLLLLTDSYKPSHWRGYPEGLTQVFSYLSSRGGQFAEVVNFGWRMLAERYLVRPVTRADVAEAADLYAAHFGDDRIFNREGWLRLVEKHDGRLPVEIRWAPEGMVIPARNVLGTIENTDDEFPWLVNYLESLLLQLWYPMTVATRSREVKKLIHAQLVATGDTGSLPFKLHDFGFRGSTSVESAMVGGLAHLVNFMGTDTVPALWAARRYYDEPMAGYSIPATEHSVMTMLGELGEVEQFKRFISAFKDASVPALAVVSDSYNIYEAVGTKLGEELRGLVQSLGQKVLVVRPDSGDPPTIVRQVVELLDARFGSTVNGKGYKVLNGVRVIQGDGITLDSIPRIMDELVVRRYSIDNVAFGMGGGLLQADTRDTNRFAIKASSAVIKGQRRDVYKNPVTDAGKRSFPGRMKLVDQGGVLTTVAVDVPGQDLLQVGYRNGELLERPTLATIRERAALR